MYKIPDTLNEDIAKLGDWVKGFREGSVPAVQFKAFRVPMGIYEQRKDDVYMVRIRTTGGVIYPEQLLEVMEIARRHRSDLLHITTRQEIQIQNLELEEITPVLYELKAAGLSAKGGGGNTVRNILVSEESGIFDGEIFDTTPYAMALTTKLIAEPDSYLLPRKMKIAFSSDDRQIDYAAINDLGLVAKIKNGRRGFMVYAGGGGGSNPSVGWLLSDFVPENELYAIAGALKTMFSEHGNRKNKHKARLRYIFYRLGEEATLRLIGEYYEAAKKTAPLFAPEAAPEERPHVGYTPPTGIRIDDGYDIWRKRYVREQRQEGYNSILVPFMAGNLRIDHEASTKAVKKLLHFVAPFGRHTIRFTTTQNIRLRNIPAAALPELYLLLKDIVPEMHAPLLVNNIVSCTGADTCRLGVALSKGLAAAIRKELMNSTLDLERLSDTRIHISGCPNSCGQQIWADIGFSGKILRNDRIYPGYQVHLAANRGNKPHIAEPAGQINARDIPKFVVRLLASFLEVQPRYPNLTAWLETDGKKQALQLLAAYEEVPSFADDKNYYFDWGAETVFSVIGRGAAECSAGLFDMIDFDLNLIEEHRKTLETETNPQETNRHLYGIGYSASRMLLITRGAEPKTTEDVFEMFATHFIAFGLVDERFRKITETLKQAQPEDELPKDEILALADTVIELYKNMDDSLQFKTAKTETPAEPPKPKTEKRFKDLRGVLCPMNFVQTKIQLAPMKNGELLEIWLDDGQPIANVPGSVRGEGHEVLEQTRMDDYWKVVIRKQ
ncbi:MAG: sulfurtransferase TusA family protein [Bacteroidales bacterium]|jgi:sulfite reductase (ferredoxin)|nr:sulfurtransferase TusA family protein [Bacteroidales bacterium]